MRRKKAQPEVAIKCDYCGKITDIFIVNAEHLKFCRHQYPGHKPTKDCMTDYLQDPKNKTPIIPLPNTIYKSDFYS